MFYNVNFSNFFLKIWGDFILFITHYEPPLIHPLKVENCEINSRLVVDEDSTDKFWVGGVKLIRSIITWQQIFFCYNISMSLLQRFDVFVTTYWCVCYNILMSSYQILMCLLQHFLTPLFRETGERSRSADEQWSTVQVRMITRLCRHYRDHNTWWDAVKRDFTVWRTHFWQSPGEHSDFVVPPVCQSELGYALSCPFW